MDKPQPTPPILLAPLPANLPESWDPVAMIRLLYRQTNVNIEAINDLQRQLADAQGLHVRAPPKGVKLTT